MTIETTHCDAAPQQTFFQRHQFDLSLDVKKAKLKLSTQIDYDETYGMRFFKLRDIQAVVPEWTLSDQKIRELIDRVFPKWRDNPVQCARASRWASVIYLHYRLHLSLAGVADHMEISEEQVRNVLNRVKRAAAGRRANNTALRKAQ